MTLLFQDTFTDPDATRVEGTSPSHVPNLGATAEYIGNMHNAALAASCFINANKARGNIGPYPGIFSDFHIIGTTKITAGVANVREIRADIFPVTSITNSIIEIIFQCRHGGGDPTTPATTYFAIHLRKLAAPANTWAVYASYGPYQNVIIPSPYVNSAPRFSPQLGTVVMADAGAGLRLGATRYQTTRLYDFWTEPAGGGARTPLGSFTFPSYLDSDSTAIGLAWTGPSSSATLVDFDNLEADDSGASETDPPPTFVSARSMEVVGFATHANVTGLAAQFVRGNRGFLAIGTNTPTWLSDIKRWVRPATSSGVDTILGTNTNPHPIPVYLKSGSPNSKWVLVDEMRVRRTAGVGSKSAFFGVGRFSGGGLLRETIGFSSVASGTAAANWFAKVQADDGSIPISVDLGISDAALHELMLILNGVTREIEWHIDRVRKHKAALPAGVGGMLNTNEPHVGTRLTSPDATNTIILDSEMYGTGGLILVER